MNVRIISYCGTRGHIQPPETVIAQARRLAAMEPQAGVGVFPDTAPDDELVQVGPFTYRRSHTRPRGWVVLSRSDRRTVRWAFGLDGTVRGAPIIES